MSDTVIRVENLSKKYVIGHQKQERYTSLRDVIADKVRGIGNIFNRHAQEQDEAFEEFWALKDVSFEIKQGDRVGIIGRNGAGKSTLLKILSRITEPTSGRISIKGRVASLLEVGTGFHPELTGRENIFLNGAILGMDRFEIKKKFDEIVAFAEVEKFLDTPVKRYSSGMYVRLAFAVAAHLEPEILIVDEVLAVGDSQFQKKCLGKMEDVAEKEGKTIILVSHNLQSVSRLCSVSLWLDHGELRKFDSSKKVIDSYFESSRKVSLNTWKPSESLPNAPFIYEKISVISPDGTTIDSISANQDFEIEFRYKVTVKKLLGRIGLYIRNSDGVVVFSSSNTDRDNFVRREWLCGKFIEKCSIPKNLLIPGKYYLTVSQPTENGGDKIHEDICCFVIDSGDNLLSRDGRQGVIAPLLSWSFL
ncbi:ABC transporter ATP-binding protein [Pseudanabaena mucicola]|uniref:ABC transporter ATP-binding protein n=1 Tax=Pseudanabaena mucicola FACHB-723 TaxID=2692860 RepID=A0ABR7ZUD7_9CYAN|nr:ABC transporter ATP-binding protein [Pseudanabaena mucicola]MBD2187100.1 ABC transporter ATP-binding protein [Pseudanabaena mucicola FACHB-723]